MKKQLRFLMLTLLCSVFSTVWGADEVFYTLTPAKGSNNSYAGNCDIAIDGITWNLEGNSQELPWRIGGKSLKDVDRAVYSKTAMGSAISKVELEVGAASGITVNSTKLIVASDASFNNILDEVTKTFSANSTLTFTPTSGTEWATDAYYKFVFNVTVSGTKNKFIEFKEATFYKLGGGVTLKDPDLSFPEDSYSATLGEAFTAPTLATAEDFDETVLVKKIHELYESADGAVTLVGAGTTTIKASSAQTKTFKAGEASYTLTVVDPNVQEGSVTYDFMQITNDYGSGVSSTSNSNFYITEAKTWTNTPVTLVTEGKYRWWSANDNPGDIRFHESESSTPSRMVFSVPEGYSITKVELTGEKINYWTTDGTYTSSSSNGTWKGNAQSVVFNYTKPANKPYNIIVKTAIVTFTKTTTPQPDAPVIWMTYSSDNDLDFTGKTDYTAYIATNYRAEEGVVVLTKIEKVPSGEGILIKSNDSSKAIKDIFKESDVPANEPITTQITQMLVGAPAGVEYLLPEEGDYTNFVLAKKDGVVGFYKVAQQGTLAPNKAYLQIPTASLTSTSGANGITFVEDGTTAIQSVTTATTDDAWYTLQGVRVAQPTRGLYIHNGKKVVVK